MKSFGSVRGVGLLLFAATVCVSGAGSVFADDRYPQWVGSVDSATITVDNTLGTFKDCTQKQINVVLMNRKPDEPYSRETTACVYQNADLEVADFYALNGQVGMAIKRTSDAVFTHLHNKEDSYNATKDTLIYQTGPGTKLVVVKDLSNNIILSEDNNGELTRYSIRQNAEQSLLMRGNDPRAFYEVTHHTLSANGRYVATYVDYEGIVRIDLETGERTSIYKKKGSWLSGPRNIYPAAISDDGQYILLGPSFKMIEMYDCGEEFTGSFEPGGDWCIAGDYNQGIYELLGYSYTISAARFTNNEFGVEINTELIRGGTVYYGDGLPRHINVSVTGGMRTPRLNYLALGDSFSSGEGDIDNDGFWYIDGTDQRDQCHISLRSYPYLLKQNWGIDNASMKSITCSGAKVEPDYFGGDEYIGQRGELKNKTNEEKQTFRAAALDNFTPGIVQQINFVEKYKPKTLTLTAGGNDVGFGSILAYCASPMEIESSRSLEGYTTCAHANDPQIAANLRKTIDDIRQPLTNLINTIKELSPQTKVYLIGYPQFVAQDGCIQGSIFLDLLERNMIRSSVSRLNNILKLVASDTDTYYVSIEDSLEGGQICQGSRYMTGPLQIFGKIIDGYSQEAYHPNAKGHEKIAQEISRRIKEEDMSYTIIDIPVEENGQRVIKKAVTKNYMGVGSTYTVEMGPGIFNPDGTIDIVKFSKKIHLGTYKANADGSLRAAITIPQDAELGNHLLTLTGTSTKGDTVQVQQFITIYDDKAAIVNEANTDKTKQTSLVNDNYVAAQPIFASDMNTAQLKPVENLELRNDSTDLSSTGKLDNSIWPNNSLLVIGLVSAILTLLGATLYAKKTSKKPS